MHRSTPTPPKNRWAFLVVTGSFLLALWLGLMDYETTSILDLFTLENFPMLMIFTIVFSAPILGLGFFVRWLDKKI